MPVLRVALAQIDVTVGDLAGNAAVILDRTGGGLRSRRRPRPVPRASGHRLPARGPGLPLVVPGGVARDDREARRRPSRGGLRRRRCSHRVCR